MNKHDYKTQLKIRCVELQRSMSEYGKKHWLYHVFTGRLEAYATVLEELDMIEDAPEEIAPTEEEPQ